MRGRCFASVAPQVRLPCAVVDVVLKVEVVGPTSSRDRHRLRGAVEVEARDVVDVDRLDEQLRMPAFFSSAAARRSCRRRWRAALPSARRPSAPPARQLILRHAQPPHYLDRSRHACAEFVDPVGPGGRRCRARRHPSRRRQVVQHDLAGRCPQALPGSAVREAYGRETPPHRTRPWRRARSGRGGNLVEHIVRLAANLGMAAVPCQSSMAASPSAHRPCRPRGSSNSLIVVHLGAHRDVGHALSRMTLDHHRHRCSAIQRLALVERLLVSLPRTRTPCSPGPRRPAGGRRRRPRRLLPHRPR